MATTHDELLDQAAAAMREQPIGSDEVAAARGRVWQKITEATRAAPAEAPLRGCEDVRALRDRYRAGTLPPGRELLVQDHLRECVACRSVFAERAGAKLLPWRTGATVARGRSILPRLAMAATLLVFVGAAYLLRGAFVTAPPGARATLLSADGPVYLVSPRGHRPVFAGVAIEERDWVRTPRGSRAVLRLSDGSQVELHESAEVGVSMNRRDLTVHLERGSVIVRAAKQRDGALRVVTDDATVSVQGTIFSVSRGLKGTRVSVIEGSVRVDDRRGERALRAGEQHNTGTALASLPVGDDISWSSEREQHLALLGGAPALGQAPETVRLPGLRYESRLLPRLPAETLIYAAVPNYGKALQDAYALFEQQLQGNAELRRWWTSRADLQSAVTVLIERVRRASEHLGDELVLALVRGEAGAVHPVVVAEIVRPGLRALLDGELGQLDGGDRLQVVDAAALASAPPAHRGLLAVVTDGLVAIGPRAAQLRKVLHPEGPTLAGTAFGQKLTEAYRDGAGLLLAADVHTLTNGPGMSAADDELLGEVGAKGAQFLIVEQETVRDKTHNRATLTFDGPRQGIASWLAAPAPMGALDFVGSGASFAAAFVVKEPALVLDDLMRIGARASTRFRDSMQALEWRTGVALRDDLAAPLGNDLAVAIDGPLLPVPSWKLVMEVHDPDRVADTLARLVNDLNGQLAAAGKPPVIFERRAWNGPPLTAGPVTSRHSFVLRTKGAPLEIRLLFSDGYMVAGPNDEALHRALSIRRDGRHLRSSWRFRGLLPADRQANASGFVYHNLGQAGAAVGDWFAGTRGMDPQHKQALEALTRDAQPGLFYVQGEPQQIQVAMAGGLFGLRLEHLLGSASLVDLLQQPPPAPAPTK